MLSRKLGEKVFIGDRICVTVVDIDRGKIRIGIEAPRHVPVYRQELMTPEQQREFTTVRPPPSPPAAVLAQYGLTVTDWLVLSAAATESLS